MKTYLYILSLASLLSFSDSAVLQKGFTISGFVTGFADSTRLYLDVASGSGKAIDSTYIINGQFHFEGVIKQAAEKVLIKTKNLSDYKFFWLENNAIWFKAEKGKFRTAVITGSGTQELEDKLITQITPIRKEQENVHHLIERDSAALNKERLQKQLQHLGQKEKDAYVQFIINHPASIISANLLSVYATTWGKPTTSDLYRRLTPAIKQTSYGKSVAEYIALNQDIRIGNPYVNFTQLNHKGQPVSVADFKGKILLLEFWASWCGPCRKENPELVKTYLEFKDKGFEILGVSLDDQEASWKAAINTDGLVWPNVSDLKGDKNKAALIYGINAVPDNFLIDKEGNIIARNLRGEHLKNKLKELFP